MRRRPALAVLLAAALVLSAVATVPAAAATADDDTEDAGPIDDLFDVGDTTTLKYVTEHPWAAAKNVTFAADDYVVAKLEKYRYKFNQWRGEGLTSSKEIAANASAFYNANNASFEAYINEHIDNASTAYNVFRINITQDGTTTTIYAVGDVNESGDIWTYENTRVLNATEFEATNYSVDETVLVDDIAAAKLNEDVRTFHEQYVQEDKSIREHPGFAFKLKARNDEHIAGTLPFLPDELPDDQTEG